MTDRKFTITGPGAADFIASGGGEDLPGFSPGKGTRQNEGSNLTDPKNLIPRLGPDTEAHPSERRPEEQMTGSQTGTIGGGGFDAHNPDAIRATGVDDETVEE